MSRSGCCIYRYKIDRGDHVAVTLIGKGHCDPSSNPGWVYLRIDLRWLENPVNTYARHTETLDSCFDHIWSHQQCIPWSPPLEIKPVTTDCRAETLQLSHQSISHTSDAKLTSHGICVRYELLAQLLSFGSAICDRWFNLHWGRSLYTLLMRPNKIKTTVKCFHMSCVSVRRIFWSW